MEVSKGCLQGTPGLQRCTCGSAEQLTKEQFSKEGLKGLPMAVYNKTASVQISWW
jgi:hypothetical protein